jgi:Protein of unknown function (DUF2510)
MRLTAGLIEKGKKVAGQGAGRLSDFAADHVLGPRLTALMEIKDDAAVSPTTLLVALVDAVRGDEEHAHGIDLERRGRRNERIQLLVRAAPGAGLVAGYVADLYCDAAIVCAVVEKHGLDLTTESIAEHLLVLWGAAPDLGSAELIIRGDSRLLFELASNTARLRFDGTSKRDVVKALWQLRRAGLSLGGSMNLKGVLLPRQLVAQRVDAAERQLVQWYPDPFGRFDHRFWDRAWTEHVSLAGAELIDPPVSELPPGEGRAAAEADTAPAAAPLATRPTRHRTDS